MSEDLKPSTRRGVLSLVNSLFDPVGFLAPEPIQVQIILRQIMDGTVDCDKSLLQEKQAQRTTWRDLLKRIEQGSYPQELLT